MRKNHLLVTAFIVQLATANFALAQESNLNEDYSAYLPEVRAFNKQLAQIPQTGTTLTKEGLLAARKTMEAIAFGKPQLQPSVKNIKGPAGNIALRIFKPDTIRAVVMDIHGGAWSIGTAASDDRLNDEMARTCKVAVVSVDYRLAPEAPFPACIEDCKAAAKWLVLNARSEFGTDKLFISGASAGGHLSAVTAIYIRDSLHAIDKVKGVNLMYGCFDLGRTPSSRQATDSTLILYKKSMNEVVQLVFPGWSMEQRQKPEYSPLYADLKNLPPALFTVGTVDPLIDDTFFMEDRWRMAGNKTFLAVYPESPHAFNFFPSKIARAANDRMFQWISVLCSK